MQHARALRRTGLLAFVVVLALGFLLSHHAGSASPQHVGHSPSVEHTTSVILELGAETPGAVVSAVLAEPLAAATAAADTDARHVDDLLRGALPAGEGGHSGLLACLLALVSGVLIVLRLRGVDGALPRPASLRPCAGAVVRAGGRHVLLQQGVLRI